jgi:hypothetical protein
MSDANKNGWISPLEKGIGYNFLPFRAALDPGVYSASDRSDYKKHQINNVWGVK